MLTWLEVEDLPEVPVEFAEAIFILLVEEDSLHEAIVVQSLVQLLKEVELDEATFSLRHTPVPTVKSHHANH